MKFYMIKFEKFVSMAILDRSIFKNDDYYYTGPPPVWHYNAHPVFIFFLNLYTLILISSVFLISSG